MGLRESVLKKHLVEWLGARGEIPVLRRLQLALRAAAAETATTVLEPWPPLKIVESWLHCEASGQAVDRETFAVFERVLADKDGYFSS
ncbi:MAG TPA: hypothetical protein VGC79_01935, partial [Polyangiaceae bacterium]